MKKSIGPKTIVFPAPAFVVATYGKDGKANAMTAAWAGICCSSPPCIAVSLRKATATYSNMVTQKAFTINIPSENLVKVVDYFGIATGKEVDKFEVTGVTPVKSELVNAPYIMEFPFVLECRVIRIIEIGLHTQFIGEIMDIKADDSIIGDECTLEIEKVKPVMYAPEVRKYFGMGRFLGKVFHIGRDLI